MSVKCYWMELTDEVKISLRRYSQGSECPGSKGKYGYHNAAIPVDKDKLRFETRETESGHKYTVIANAESDYKHRWPKNYKRWPKICDFCSYRFTDDDPKQIFIDPVYRRQDTGEELTQREFTDGAMWDAWWMKDLYGHKNPDGRVLTVICPGGGQWTIDGRANNCGMPDDNEHCCWVRHGEPPNITVNKDGNTCAAGGGSIVAGDYHGFLRNGEFTNSL